MLHRDTLKHKKKNVKYFRSNELISALVMNQSDLLLLLTPDFDSENPDFSIHSKISSQIN